MGGWRMRIYTYMCIYNICIYMEPTHLRGRWVGGACLYIHTCVYIIYVYIWNPPIYVVDGWVAFHIYTYILYTHVCIYTPVWCICILICILYVNIYVYIYIYLQISICRFQQHMHHPATKYHTRATASTSTIRCVQLCTYMCKNHRYIYVFTYTCIYLHPYVYMYVHICR